MAAWLGKFPPPLPQWQDEGLAWDPLGLNSLLKYIMSPGGDWVLVSNVWEIFTPIWGKWSNLTNMFQMGWKHQLGWLRRKRFLESLKLSKAMLPRNLFLRGKLPKNVLSFRMLFSLSIWDSKLCAGVCYVFVQRDELFFVHQYLGWFLLPSNTRAIRGQAIQVMWRECDENLCRLVDLSYPSLNYHSHGPENRPKPKRKRLSPNNQFSGAKIG